MAGSLESVISQIPGLAGYRASEELNQRRNLQELQQAGALQGIVAKMRENALAQAYRDEIAAGGDPLKVAEKYLGPKEAVSHADVQARIRANQETAASRLMLSASQFNERMAAAEKAGASKEDLARARLQFESSLKLAAARYNLPEDMLAGVLGGPQLPAARYAPPGTPAAAGFTEPTAAQVPPEDRGAFEAVRNASGAGRAGMTVQTERVIPPAEGATMGTVPQATVAPVAAPVPTPQPADAANLDVRDLLARRGDVGAPAPIPAPAPATPVTGGLPPMPPEIARAPRKTQDAWKLQQTRQSIAGGGVLAPDTLEFVAKQYLKGDRQAVQGFARNATARIALQNAIVDEAKKQGMSPEATAAKMAEFAGTIAGSRTVGQRAANISLAATEAEEMIGIVKQTSDNFARTQFVPWNMALRAYESGTGTPEIAAFGAAVNALVNVYARAINPTGQPTVSDKQHARAVLNTVQSPEQVDAVLGIIGRELAIAKRAPGTVREATRQAITGETTTQGGWSIRPK